MTVQKLSDVLRILIVSYLFSEILFNFAAWLATTQGLFATLLKSCGLNYSNWIQMPMTSNGQLINSTGLPLSNSAMLIGLCGCILYLIVLTAISLIGLKLCKLYRQNNIFSYQHTKYYRSIGSLLITLGCFVNVIVDATTTMAFTFDQGVSKRILHLEFGLENIKTIFFGLTLYLLSQIMHNGLIIKDEQDLTI